MPGPSIDQLQAMFAAYKTGEPMEPTPTPEPEPTAEPVKLDLKDQFIPGNAWLPLDEEITEDMGAKLIDALIAYINKLDFPPRFKDARHAYAYFEIMSDATITRINELATKLKEEKEAPPVTEPEPEPEPVV